MSRLEELLEKRKNLTLNIFEEEELIKLSKNLSKDELDKIDSSLLTYSNDLRLNNISNLLNKMKQIIQDNK